MSKRNLAAVLVAVVVATAACSSDHPTQVAGRGDCPAPPVSVLVTVDQWGTIVRQLAGDCARVATVLTSPSADPHEFEPTPADSAKFDEAQLVVVNGLGYDSWAQRALDSLGHRPPVVDAGRVVGLHTGDNPHIWYGPDHVRRVSAAVTAALIRLEPDARSYLERQATRWKAAMAPYDEEITKISALASGKSFAATEPVFDDMAEAVGLTNATPRGYQDAAMNDSDPTPADIAAFESSLRRRAISVLIYNTQTEGPTPEQIRRVAEDAGIPVVDVTETVPAGAGGFVQWQVAQLRDLARALSG